MIYEQQGGTSKYSTLKIRRMDEVIVMRLMLKKFSYLFTILLVVFLSSYTNVNNKIGPPANLYEAEMIASSSWQMIGPYMLSLPKLMSLW